MGPRPGHQCSKCQQCWQRGPGVDATRRHQGRGRVMPCGVGTWHAGMERVSNRKRKRNKKKLTKWRRCAQWPALMNPEEWRGRLTQQAVGWGINEGWGCGMGGWAGAMCEQHLERKSEQRETIERKKNYSPIMKTIPGQCQGHWHSAEARHWWSWKRLGEHGWCGAWQQPLKMRL